VSALSSALKQITRFSTRLGNMAATDVWGEEDPDGAFHWTGQVASRKLLRIIGANGSIRASGIEGSEVSVLAVKRGDLLKMPHVRIELEETLNEVRVYVVYPALHRFQRRNVEVNFAVDVPFGVNLIAQTSNGHINANSLDGDSELFTGNGTITLTDSNCVKSETVNGSIRASIREFKQTRPMHFRTANGSITLELTKDMETKIRAKTNNGTITSNFALTHVDKKSRNYLIGILGNDYRRELICECGNGSIHFNQAV
jgi:hypothetical protein